MKLVRATFFVCLFTICAVNAGLDEDYIARRSQNSYTVYEHATFENQSRSTTYAKPRGMKHSRPYSREDLILDIPPLEDTLKVGDKVFAPIGRDRYSPAKVVSFKGMWFSVKPVCNLKAPPVGIYDDYIQDRIKDSSLTASSAHYEAKYGRLHPYTKGINAWCPQKKDFKNPWLKIDLEKFYFICSVKTSGLNIYKYTLTYTLSLSTDGKKWEDVRENGKTKVFKRHPSPATDHQYVGSVDKPYRYIKIYPTFYKVWPCLNVEVYGYGHVVKKGPFPLSFPIEMLRVDWSICKLRPPRCRPHTECSTEGKIPGSFACTDIDECKDKHACGSNSLCHNTEGSFHCTCQKGFRKFDNQSCSDIDECKPACQGVDECALDPCGVGGACTNTHGSFSCNCTKGYHLNKKSKLCEDIDECHRKKHKCHKDALCKNTPGSFDCECKQGFVGDGYSCADTNECNTGEYKCPSHSVCSNLFGSYKCACKQGYHKKGSKCKKDGSEDEHQRKSKVGRLATMYQKVASAWNEAPLKQTPSIFTLIILAIISTLFRQQ